MAGFEQVPVVSQSRHTAMRSLSWRYWHLVPDLHRPSDSMSKGRGKWRKADGRKKKRYSIMNNGNYIISIKVTSNFEKKAIKRGEKMN